MKLINKPDVNLIYHDLSSTFSNWSPYGFGQLEGIVESRLQGWNLVRGWKQRERISGCELREGGGSRTRKCAICSMASHKGPKERERKPLPRMGNRHQHPFRGKRKRRLTAALPHGTYNKIRHFSGHFTFERHKP